MGVGIMKERHIKSLLKNVLSVRKTITLQDFEKLCYQYLGGKYHECLRQSDSRPNELKLEQRVRNIVCHKNYQKVLYIKTKLFILRRLNNEKI